MSIKLISYPRQHISPSPTHNNEWYINSLPAYIELLPENQTLPTGWVLIRATLLCNGVDCTTRLLVELENGNRCHIPLTVTLKGTIIEVVRLPKTSRRLFLEPMQSIGFFQLSEPHIKPVSWLERITKMANRVSSLYRSYPLVRLRTAGLHAHISLLNLEKAYQIASLFRTFSAPPSYVDWLEKFDLLLPNDRRRIVRQIKKWRVYPKFQIVILADSLETGLLKQTLASLEKQLFRNFQAILLTNKGQHNEISMAFPHRWLTHRELPDDTGSLIFDTLANIDKDHKTWFICLRLGERLAEHALFWLASEAIQHQEAAFIYSDYDFISHDNCRVDPVFNPDWSPELLRSTNYMANAAAIRIDVLEQAGGLTLTLLEPPDFHDVFLRCTERLTSIGIRHIPAMLWHLHDKRLIVRQSIEQEVVPNILTNQQIATQTTFISLPAHPGSIVHTTPPNPVANHLKRLGIHAAVQQQGPATFHVSYGLPKQPTKVSIIIPTRDAYDHLFACVENLLNKSTYRNFELIIVDNQSREENAISYIKQISRHPQVKVIDFPHPFNYSRMNNLAASTASGEVLCLLNNDTEVITPNWLEEMLGHLSQTQVAIVGAKLYYSDGRVQHAGDTVGPGGCANHLHRLIGRHDPGYCGRAQLAQDLSAVTGACLLTWKHVFLQLGGLDDLNLPVSFNDVDYCLRVRDAGYRVIWTPHAEMYHHESATRNKEPTAKKLAQAKAEASYFRKRWAHLLWHDPFYNPNLSYVRPDFSLSHAPVINKPW